MRVSAGSFNVSVRPYTLRKGDTLDSIAKKRGKRRGAGLLTGGRRARARAAASLLRTCGSVCLHCSSIARRS